MCPRLSANYVSCCPPNMAQVSVWAGNLQSDSSIVSAGYHLSRSYTIKCKNRHLSAHCTLN